MIPTFVAFDFAASKQVVSSTRSQIIRWQVGWQS